MPQKLWAVNRFGEAPRLVLVGGQFIKSINNNRPATEPVTGTERLYKAMDLRVYYSDGNDDYLPPTIWEAHAYLFNDNLYFIVKAEDDASGVAEVIVSYNPTGQVKGGQGLGQWTSFALTYDSDRDIWRGKLPGGDPNTAYYVQVVDGAGNVQMSANKGLFFATDEDPDLFLSHVYLPLVVK